MDVLNPEKIAAELHSLRLSLLADPYFRDVPSMQPHRQKTASCFHAKDDLPEIRREVFALLHRYIEDVRFLAVVRDKWKLLSYVRQRNERDPSYRYNPNELYDFMVRNLFRNVLHKDDGYQICFAKRGASDRTAALELSLETARRQFSERWGKASHATVHVTPSTPQETVGLQVADYYLWALQRLYERGEDRYVTYLQPAFRYIHDMDDTREAQYGVFYTSKKPLSRAALAERLYLDVG